MSDRPCNWCSLQELRRLHADVEIREDMGMPCAFVGGKPVAWFMALPESCACDDDGDVPCGECSARTDGSAWYRCSECDGVFCGSHLFMPGSLCGGCKDMREAVR